MTFQQFLREDMEMRLLGQCDLTAAHCILDVACGRGDRLLSVAQASSALTQMRMPLMLLLSRHTQQG